MGRGTGLRGNMLRVVGVVLGMAMLGGMAAAAAGAQVAAGPGVSRELARDRALRVSDIHYQLSLTLRAHADTMPGREVLRFRLSGNQGTGDLPLDFRDGTVASATLNGGAIATSLRDGHLVLPASGLHAGLNTVEIAFAPRIAAAGAAVTRYEDKDDGGEYLYSLFVPMDASMAFPCFDQPDLKAGFSLSVDAPADWKVIGNTAPEGKESSGAGAAKTWFPETRPLPTYLFAFTAGPWVSVHPTPGQPSVYVRRSQVKRAEPEVPQLQSITQRGIAWLSDYFQQPFPFPKYDIVLIPGFPFGGMEHAGATFLREDSVLFRTAPTASDRFGRNTLTLHELTHQWFGDLVTMRWFDDLWLKEGFAQYMAYRCLDALEPGAGAWKHFYEDIKPLAYGIDETEGTTPIFQNIPNLKDAKSAYGAIVYQKAPSILKQLEFQLGADAFRDGLRLYLRQHAYGNARWSDLVDAFHASSGQNVRAWADAWVLRRGMPEVTAAWSCDAAGRVKRLSLAQRDVLPDGFVWPLSNEVLLGDTQAGHTPLTLRVNWSTAEVEVREAAGKACPEYVFANSGDQAYGRFLLDEKSERAIREGIARGKGMGGGDPLLRSMLWGGLWENVHVARSAPRGYVELVLDNLPRESDETLARIQGGHAASALHFYLTASGRRELVPKLEDITRTRMMESPEAGLRIVSFRTLTSIAETPAGLKTLKDLLAGRVAVPGVALRPLDRWNLVGHLVMMGDPEAGEIFAAELARDKTGDAEKYAFAAKAGTPDAATKAMYFAEYRQPPNDPKARPEDWLTQSLRPFNSWNQGALTAPWLGQALDQLPAIKRDRKIFYLGAWLGAFLGGQTTPESEAVVQQWLAQPGIDRDLRLKVLENFDELQRTVRIRQRFPD
jgi:aminopeptidase N